MQLLTAWKDSLGIFKPANFKLFCLVTLKSYIETMKVWLVHWGWLALALIGVTYFFSLAEFEPVRFLISGFHGNELLGTLSAPTLRRAGFIAQLMIALLWISLFLTTRSSVKIKNFAYYASYGKQALWLLLWFIVQGILFSVLLLPLILAWMWVGVPVNPENQTLLVFLLVNCMFGIYCAFWAGITSLFALFLFDSDGSTKSALKSLARSCKFIVYNVPFYLIMTAILGALYYVLVMVTVSMQSLGAGSATIVMQSAVDLIIAMPIFACVVTNYYSKKIHDQFALYFGPKS